MSKLGLILSIVLPSTWSISEFTSTSFSLSSIVSNSSKIGLSDYESGQGAVLSSQGQVIESLQVQKLSHLAGFDANDKVIVSRSKLSPPLSSGRVATIADLGILSVQIQGEFLITRGASWMTVHKNRRLVFSSTQLHESDLVAIDRVRNELIVVESIENGCSGVQYSLSTGKRLSSWKPTLSGNPVNLNYEDVSIAVLDGKVAFVGHVNGSRGLLSPKVLGGAPLSNLKAENSVLVIYDQPKKTTTCVAAWNRSDGTLIVDYFEVSLQRLSVLPDSSGFLFGMGHILYTVREAN